MFRSFASSLFTFVVILLFAFTLLFLWNGSQEIEFKRVAMEGDRSTTAVLEEHRQEQMAAAAKARPEEEAMPEQQQPDVNTGEGPPVVVWISIPGFRGDYIEKADTPFFDKLLSDGAGTNKMRPQFPCVTFPAHTTMATGVPADEHGITADRIRTEDGTIHEKPTDASLIQAEPIWETATRQGVRTLVHDWPLSQEQAGENAAAIHLDSFDPELEDAARLQKVLEAWRADAGADSGADAGGSESSDSGGDGAASPDETGGEEEGDASGTGPSEPSGEDAAADEERLRLVMLRLTDILKAGLVNGPRTDETYEAISRTDAALKTFFETLQDEWADLAPPNANLNLFITTDHGLAELDKNVNIADLLGEEMMKNADILSHDAIANLFFKDLPESEGERKLFLENFDNELSKRIYFRTLTPEELPEEWHYDHPERTGDRVFVLKTGYAFTDHSSDEPVFDPTDGPGYFGSYGYPVEESFRMSGQIILSGYPNAPASGNLGEIGQLSFHATVCELLGIEPAEGAKAETLDIR